MSKYRFFVCIFMISLVVLSGCSILHTPEDTVDYKVIEQTAAAHITQTFEAMPTATSTFTPIPTNTNTPEPTATNTPEPTEDPEEFMITRNEDGSEGGMIIRQGDAPTEVPPQPTATIVFPDKADFVSVLPSPNQFLPDQRFYLTWQIKNTGTTTWYGQYRFFHSGGIQLADQSSYVISDLVEPGGILTVVMPATAPSTTGTYQTTWTLSNPDGIDFYYVYYTAMVGDQTFITEVPELNPTVTPSSFNWMCGDAERSKIQGDGCLSYCAEESTQEMILNGYVCYANGEVVNYAE